MSSLAAVDRVRQRFQVLRKTRSKYLDAAARDLLVLLAEIYQLRRFARLGADHIADLGGFGTGLDESDAPAIMSSVQGKETWDFQPWLAEKLRSIESLIFRLCDLCNLGPNTANEQPWRRVIQVEDIGSEGVRILDGVQNYLKSMLELIESGELKIRQLSYDEDFDEGGAKN